MGHTSRSSEAPAEKVAIQVFALSLDRALVHASWLSARGRLVPILRSCIHYVGSLNSSRTNFQTHGLWCCGVWPRVCYAFFRIGTFTVEGVKASVTWACNA